MMESDGIAMLRVLAEQNALRVFAEVVAVTGYRAAGQCCPDGV
jgi:hypothetical protein